ncbi:MAG: universal stress protein [Thermomicrobiales bacterium]
MYNRIVVPLDGSAVSEAALSPAIEFARLSGATIHLVRVVDDTWLTRYGVIGLPVGAESAGDILAEEQDDATRYVAAMRAQIEQTGIPITTEIRRGRAADEIRNAVGDGDLLAIATHGRSGFSRFALGSVTEEVTRQMRSPVLLCHARKEDAARESMVEGDGDHQAAMDIRIAS